MLQPLEIIKGIPDDLEPPPDRSRVIVIPDEDDVKPEKPEVGTLERSGRPSLEQSCEFATTALVQIYKLAIKLIFE